jgi:L-fucose mutarotase
MLKGIPPLLNADLLHVLASMGHGDAIAIVDGNFPAASTSRRVLRLSGANSPAALDAVLTVFPLDTLAVPAAITMEVVGAPDDLPETVADFAATFTRHNLADAEIGRLPRDEFYQRAREAFAVVQTGETRPYGNILLVKGVLDKDQGDVPAGP